MDNRTAVIAVAGAFAVGAVGTSAFADDDEGAERFDPVKVTQEDGRDDQRDDRRDDDRGSMASRDVVTTTTSISSLATRTTTRATAATRTPAALRTGRPTTPAATATRRPAATPQPLAKPVAAPAPAPARPGPGL